MAFYKVVKDWCPELSDMIFENTTNYEDDAVICVDKIWRNNKFEDIHQYLLIEETCVEQVGDPRVEREKLLNPWGKCLYEGMYQCSGLNVSYAQFENTMQLSISELDKNLKPSKVIYTEYFSDGNCVREIIEHTITSGKADELVFYLKELKNEFSKGIK